MLLQQGSVPFDMAIAIPMFITWIIISIIAVFIIWKDKRSLMIKIALYLISIIIAGFLLGGVPNAVMPIQQIFINLGMGAAELSAILPLIIILGILILSSVLFGRLFCGYACPVGAIQELLSRIQFKSDVKSQESAKYRVDVSSKIPRIIRGIFFGIIIVLSVIWGVALLQVINPFLGYSIFKNPLIVTMVIPLLSLVVISILSIFIYRPWCRFLCPFGAIAGEICRRSLYKIERTDDCTECGLCEKVCPTQEAYPDSKKGECYLCGRCIEVCPQDALKFTTRVQESTDL
jgi:NapH/MauN family ferredoxin-type protein